MTNPIPATEIEYTERNDRAHLSRHAKIEQFISGVMRPAERVRQAEATDNQQKAIKDFESRPYQVEAWDSLWHAREAGSDRGLIHLATGLGKTSVGILDYAKFRADRIAKGESARGLFVVHQNNILTQAKADFGEILPELERATASGRNPAPAADVTFATFQFLRQRVDDIPADTYDYIIYDEAHHIEADSYKKVVEHFKPSFQLGLTATPERTDDKKITDHFGEALYSKSLPEALAEGYLANVKYQPVYDDAVVELVNSGFSPEKLAKLQQLLEQEPRNSEIAQRIKVEQDRVKAESGIDTVKTIVFCTDIAHADSIAQLLGGVSYHSGKSGDVQEDILKTFRHGDLETLTVRDMFNEGVNIPEARLIVFLRTTESKSVYEQQLGRGLRKTDTKPDVDVLDMVANIERLDMIYTLAVSVREKEELLEKEKADRPGVFGEGKLTASTGPDTDAFNEQFIFTSQLVEYLKHYHYLVEQRNNSVNWSEFANEQLVAIALELSPTKRLSAIAIEELSKAGQFPSMRIIYDRFGSLVAFQEACGFEGRRVWKNTSNEDIITLALELSPSVPLTSSDFKALVAQSLFPNEEYIRSRFGSLPAFQKACGFEVRQDWSKVSNEELVSIAKMLSPTVPLTVNQINQYSVQGEFPASQFIYKRFGSVRQFQEACGFESKLDWASLSNSEIVAIAKELTGGKRPTAMDITSLSKSGEFPSTGFIFKRFGSLKAFQACYDAL